MGARYVSAAYRELGDRERPPDLQHGRGRPVRGRVRDEDAGRGPILEFTRLAERKQGYHLSDYLIDGTLQSLIFHESSAKHVLSYEPQVIPGLLQMPDYARTLITTFDTDDAEETVAGVVRTRMERRQILYLPKPARFTFYIHEQALRLWSGADEVMHEQLLHLVLTAALDNVTIRIVPSVAGAFGVGFRLMEFYDRRSIVYLDDIRFGGLILEDPNYVNNYYKSVPKLADAALDEGHSREFAANLADAYDRGSQRGGTDVLAQEQLQPWRGNRLRGGSVEPPTPIYE